MKEYSSVRGSQSHIVTSGLDKQETEVAWWVLPAVQCLVNVWSWGLEGRARDHGTCLSLLAGRDWVRTELSHQAVCMSWTQAAL